MIHLFKNFNFGGLLVLVLGVVLMVSWKSVESKSAATGLWYPVELRPGGNASLPEDWEINPNGENEPSGDCATGDEILCAAQLTVTGQFPANMKEAQDFPGVTIDDTAHRN